MKRWAKVEKKVLFVALDIMKCFEGCKNVRREEDGRRLEQKADV